MVDGDRTEEGVVEVLVLKALADGRVKTNAQIKSMLRNWTGWTRADLAQSGSRQDEPKWHSSVNNVLTEGRGLYAAGCVVRQGKGEHEITPGGKARLSQHEAMGRAVAEAFPDELVQQLAAEIASSRTE